MAQQLVDQRAEGVVSGRWIRLEQARDRAPVVKEREHVRSHGRRRHASRGREVLDDEVWAAPVEDEMRRAPAHPSIAFRHDHLTRNRSPAGPDDYCPAEGVSALSVWTQSN